MELEYRDNSRRGKFIVVLGIVLAVVAGGAAFFLINQAQQRAASQTIEKRTVVVAVRAIPARTAIAAADVALRAVDVEAAETGVFEDPAMVIDRVPAVTILEGQPITSNLLSSSAAGGTFSILKPLETITPDSPDWRAVAVTVAPDLAVGGLLQPGMTVDVLVTASVTVPQDLVKEGKYYSDRTTKVVYQDIEILARTEDFYIVRVPLEQAEEIAHFQATSTATFSLALRPPEDTRIADASRLGSNTNLIITRYGLPIPETYPTSSGPVILPGTGSGQPSPGPGVTPEP
ncbi:MAG TPA: Flp pilus assembly protein CpaB [Candidatus Limnocylindrales bacterium]